MNASVSYTLQSHVTCPDPQRQALRSLFEVVFGSPVADVHWQWKYRGPPESHSLHVLACTQSGEPVGHVGAVVQPAWCVVGPTPSTSAHSSRSAAHPQPAWMAHLTDVMVHPKHRGGLGREGIYPRIMAAMAQHLANWQATSGQPVYAYGFPGLTPSRLGHRMGLYRPLYRVQEYPLYPSGRAQPGWAWRLHEYPLATPFDARLQAELDELDVVCVGHPAPHGPIGAPRLRKGAAYLQWRYATHPAQPYRLHLLRDPFGRLRGWRVTREHPRPVVVDACNHPRAHRAHLWAGLQGAAPGEGVATPWCTWTAEEGCGPPRPSLIVPGEFKILGPHQGWPAPAFVPGDTDVF